MTADDLAAWVRRSRTAQGLPERVTDPDAIAALATLIAVAQQTAAQRRVEQATRPTSPPDSDGRSAAAAA